MKQVPGTTAALTIDFVSIFLVLSLSLSLSVVYTFSILPRDFVCCLIYLIISNSNFVRLSAFESHSIHVNNVSVGLLLCSFFSKFDGVYMLNSIRDKNKRLDKRNKS